MGTGPSSYEREQAVGLMLEQVEQLVDGGRPGTCALVPYVSGVSSRN